MGSGAGETVELNRVAPRKDLMRRFGAVTIAAERVISMMTCEKSYQRKREGRLRMLTRLGGDSAIPVGPAVFCR